MVREWLQQACPGHAFQGSPRHPLEEVVPVQEAFQVRKVRKGATRVLQDTAAAHAGRQQHRMSVT